MAHQSFEDSLDRHECEMEPHYLATPAANSPGRAEPGFYWRTALRFVRRRETGRCTALHGGDYSHHRQGDVSPLD